MKVLVSGSRSITDFDLEGLFPPDTDTIICGGAKGVDQLAEQYADAHQLQKMIFRPKYDLYGRAAPLKRNEEMVRLADFVIIIWDGKSKGTRYTAEYTKKQGKPLLLLNVSSPPST